MNPNKKRGDDAEKIACDYLKQEGYILAEKNFRYKRAEIDLIFKQGETMVFVEVKYRKNEKFGFPEEFVSAGQQERILEAATYYLEMIDWAGAIRFDIIAIDASLEITHFEDAFY